MKSLLAFVFACLISCGVYAQSSACTANEDVVTFDFGTPQTTIATGSTVTWTASTTANTYSVATPGTLRGNTIGFALSITSVSTTAAVWVAGFPALGTQGNVPNSLDLNFNSFAPGDFVRMRMTFNRPMDKVRFNMYDVDRAAGGWHDILRIAGILNSNTTTVPLLVPTTAGRHTTSTTGAGYSEIDTTFDGNCASTSGVCNVRVDFANPVDAIEVLFVAGTGVAAPTSQRVGFNDFSYCVPRRDLSLTKTDVTPTFVAGQTGTYTLAITNIGGTQTVGTYTVTDIISTTGVLFVNPQTPGGGWTCTVATTTFARDTVNCGRSTALAGNSATTNLTLTVALAPTLTTAPIVNRAKVFGGGDPNKLTLAATGAVSICNAGNEGYRGGGATYFSGAATAAGCAYEETLLERRAALSITKTNATTTLVAGQTTTYTVTFANAGPSAAPGATFLDTSTSGLNCTTATFTSSPIGSLTVSPSTYTVATLQSTGVTVSPTFPPNSTGTFVFTCGVRATGLP